MIKVIVLTRNTQTEAEQVIEVWHLMIIYKMRFCRQIVREWVNDWINKKAEWVIFNMK